MLNVEEGRVRDALAKRVSSDVMMTPVVSADPITDIRRIAWVMLEHQVDGVPIVNETQALVGFVSRAATSCYHHRSACFSRARPRADPSFDHSLPEDDP